MTKSELIELIAAKQKHLPAKDVELAVKQILEIMSDALAQGGRIEIRGFGSFSLHFRPPRQGRNPKTGETVALSGKYVPHFKPGKDLRERVNDGAGQPDQGLKRWRSLAARAVASGCSVCSATGSDLTVPTAIALLLWLASSSTFPSLSPHWWRCSSAR